MPTQSKIKPVNPGQGGGGRATRIFGISPNSAKVGNTAPFTFHVYGRGFTNKSVIVLNGTMDRVTTFVDGGHLTCPVDMSTDPRPHTVAVRVRTKKENTSAAVFTLLPTNVPDRATTAPVATLRTNDVRVTWTASGDPSVTHVAISATKFSIPMPGLTQTIPIGTLEALYPLAQFGGAINAGIWNFYRANVNPFGSGPYSPPSNDITVVLLPPVALATAPVAALQSGVVDVTWANLPTDATVLTVEITGVEDLGGPGPMKSLPGQTTATSFEASNDLGVGTWTFNVVRHNQAGAGADSFSNEVVIS